MKGRGRGWFGDSAGHSTAAKKGRKKAGKVQVKSMKKA